jgi:O-antigen ligase
MLKLRPVLAFAAFFCLGALLSSAVFNSSNPAKTLLIIVFGPVAFVLMLIASWQGSSKVRRLCSQLSILHLLWAFLFASALILRIRSSTEIETQSLDAAALYRVSVMTIVGLALLTMLVLHRSFWPKSVMRGVLGAYCGYGLFSLLSAVWSIFPAWSAYKATEILLDTLVLAAILAATHNEIEFKTFVDLTYCLYAGLLLSAWGGVVFFPHLALQPSRGLISVQLFGVFPQLHTNSVGEYGAILAVVSVTRMRFARLARKRRALYLFTLGLGLASLILSQTRSAEIAFVCGLLLVLFFLFPRRTLIYGTISLFIIGGTGLSAVLFKFFARGQSMKMLESATGRVQWWQATWQTFLMHPWVGSGAFAAGRFGVLAKIDPNTSNVHNSFLEVLVGTGLIGFAFMLGTLVAIWILLIHHISLTDSPCLRRQLILESLAILTILTVRSAFSDTMVIHAPLFFLLVLGYAEYLHRKTSIKHSRELRTPTHVLGLAPQRSQA